ncbi:MAG: ABC-F family ATP-binding cassette domain-containing protein, partial [Bacteroidota bacterium]
MNLLSVENLSKSYCDKVLFRDVGFGIQRGEKVALVARNGSGKSTLLRILAGQDIPDEGNVSVRKDMRILYLEQDPPFDQERTIAEVLFSSDVPIIALVREYERLLDAQSRGDSHFDEKMLESVSARMDAEQAWDYETRVRQVLSRLDIHDLDRPIRTLSGGQRKRIALARVLLEPADLIILDEPTNHLDVEMVEWLEDFLSRSSLSLLLVTHDRYFLDQVCNRILELDRGKLFSHEGNYAWFLEKKAEREESESRTVEKNRNIYRTELEWARRMPKARGTKSKSRMDAFQELKKNISRRKPDDTLELDIKMNRIGGKVIELKKVNKSFGDKLVLKGFDYVFKTGERIGIVGKNGCGKTTFLNLLVGKDEPDSGKINVGETVVFGYYSQMGIELKADKRVIEVVKDHAEVIKLSDGSKVSASQFLQLFQFPPELQQTFVSRLSGGERRRLHLLTVLLKNPNFLLLDEPTNDLDLLTLATLEEFLIHFNGCLVLVSHDRYFMDKLVDHLFVFEGDGLIRDFNGNYSEYRDELDEKKSLKRKEDSAQKKIADAVKQSDTVLKRRKMNYKEKTEFERLEKELTDLESEKKSLNDYLSLGNDDHQRLLDWSSRLETVLAEIDQKSMRWL